MNEKRYNETQEPEGPSLNMMFGTYADVLFVLFPFLVIIMQRLWVGDLSQVLMRPDLSIAAAILAGLAIGKFVLGLVYNKRLEQHKERIVFFIALTLFLVMGPAMILIISIVGDNAVPGFVVFLQPILLIVAISLYTTAITISNILIRSDDGGASRALAEDETSDSRDQQPAPMPLAIPKRSPAE